MRRFNDLSVGRKLAASALLAVALLGALVWQVSRETERVAGLRAAQARASEAVEHAGVALAAGLRVSPLTRDMRLAETAEAVRAASSRAEARLAEGRGAVEAAAGLAPDAATREATLAALPLFARYAEAVAAIRDARLALLAARDERLFPASADLDGRLDLALASAEFDAGDRKSVV